MTSNGGIVRFGLFEIDLEKAELRKNGLRIKLQDQPFQVLRMLIERPGEVVTREEMRVALWPEGTFVDFDHSLNASINKLREALGDTASNPRFIETMPRRGYRFIAPAERASPALEPQPASPASDGRRRMIAVSGGLALLAVAGAFATWRFATARGTPTAESKPLTSSPGMELQPSFSPDGNYVAYIGGPGRYDSDVYIKQIGSDSVRRLTSRAEKDVSPKWSPDGRHVAFVRLLKLQHPLAAASVMTAPVLGGSERKVTDTSVTIANASVVEWFLDWFPDSENLIVVDGGPGGGAGALFGVNTRTGEKWRLTTPPTTGMGDLDPAVAPDGRSIVFTRHTGTELSAELYLLRMNSQLRPAGQPTPLRSPTPSRGPVWTPDGREILFASGPRHRMRLWRMRIAPGSVPQPVPFGVEGTFPLSAAMSKRWQLAYPVSQTAATIYRTKLLPDKRLESSSERFLRSSFFEHMPEYSPDAKRIAFVSNRSGSEQIWVSDSEGQNPHQLTFLAGNTEASWPRWSPDGRRLLFASANSVYVIALDGGPPSLLLRNVATTVSIADWSPDRKWIYFSSDRTGRQEVWKVKMGSGELNSEMLQVTKNGGGFPRVSPDGRFIYYAKGIYRPELWKVPVEGGDEARVLDALCHNGSFTVVNEGVYFAPPPTAGPGTTRLMFLDAQTRSQSVVAPVSQYPGWGMSVSADGRSILRVEIDYQQESNLMIVETFR